MQGHFCHTLIQTGMTNERVRCAVDCLNTPLTPHELAKLGAATNGQSARKATYSKYSSPTTPTRSTTHNTVTTPTRNNNVCYQSNKPTASASASRQQIGRPSFVGAKYSPAVSAAVSAAYATSQRALS